MPLDNSAIVGLAKTEVFWCGNGMLWWRVKGAEREWKVLKLPKAGDETDSGSSHFSRIAILRVFLQSCR